MQEVLDEFPQERVRLREPRHGTRGVTSSPWITQATLNSHVLSKADPMWYPIARSGTKIRLVSMCRSHVESYVVRERRGEYVGNRFAHGSNQTLIIVVHVPFFVWQHRQNQSALWFVIFSINVSHPQVPLEVSRAACLSRAASAS